MTSINEAPPFDRFKSFGKALFWCFWTSPTSVFVFPTLPSSDVHLQLPGGGVRVKDLHCLLIGNPYENIIGWSRPLPGTSFGKKFEGAKFCGILFFLKKSLFAFCLSDLRVPRYLGTVGYRILEEWYSKIAVLADSLELRLEIDSLSSKAHLRWPQYWSRHSNVFDKFWGDMVLRMHPPPQLIVDVVEKILRDEAWWAPGRELFSSLTAIKKMCFRERVGSYFCHVRIEIRK